MGSSDDSFLSFIGSVAGDSHVRVEENLGGGFVRLRSTEAERRQAKHDIRSVEDIVIELLRNARDAGASTIFVATTRDGDCRTFAVLDDGDGIPEDMHEAIFEPRVTSKLDTMHMDRWGVHGRGMALFSIKTNCKEARVAASGRGLGSAVYVSADTGDLPEKADQSTHPQLGRDDEGALCVKRGPHNINRVVAEFALETLGRVDVYLGSPTEVAAALVEYAEEHDEDFPEGGEAVPICLRLDDTLSAAEFSEACAELGLAVSERTAHRVLNGQVKAASPYAQSMFPAKGRVLQPNDIFKDSRSLKIAPQDLEAFSRRLESAFEGLAEQYYISLADEPKIKVGRDGIKVVFPIEKE